MLLSIFMLLVLRSLIGKFEGTYFEEDTFVIAITYTMIFSMIFANTINLFIQKFSSVISDIQSVRNIDFELTEFISNNAKSINEKYYNTVDLVITSPPYVNGTNYFRNTN